MHSQCYIKCVEFTQSLIILINLRDNCIFIHTLLVCRLCLPVYNSGTIFIVLHADATTSDQLKACFHAEVLECALIASSRAEVSYSNVYSLS